MPGISQTITDYHLGISTQPDHKKIPGQLKDIVNCTPDLNKGLSKRHGSKRIGTGPPLTNVQSEGKFFHYFRDETEGSYIGQIANDGKVRMWSCKDGSEKTVWYDTVGTAYSDSNVAHKSITDYLGQQGVKSIELESGGAGYTSPPTVTITNTSGSTGSDATAMALISETGAVTEVIVLNRGKNYSAGATVTFSGGGGSGAAAKDNKATLYEVDKENIQPLTINDTTFLTNRSVTVKDNFYGTYIRGTNSGIIKATGRASAIDGVANASGTSITRTAGTWTISGTGGSGEGIKVKVVCDPLSGSTVTLIDGGYGYTDNDVITLSKVGTYGGDLADITVNVNGVADITDFVSTSDNKIKIEGGHTFVKSDIVKYNDGRSAAAIDNITNAGATGGRTAGTYYIAGTGGSGSGLECKVIIAVNGSATVTIHKPGTGYTDDDTITLSKTGTYGGSTDITVDVNGFLAGIGGLTHDQTYYIIRVDSDYISLATSAGSSTAVNLTSLGNNAQYLRKAEVVITKANHNFSVGERVNVDFTSGGATDGIYTVINVEDSNTFSVYDTVIDTITTNNCTCTPLSGSKAIDVFTGELGKPDKYYAYVEVLRTENGRQYAMNIYNDDTSSGDLTVKSATRINLKSHTQPNTEPSNGSVTASKNTGHCPGIGTQVYSVEAAANYTNQPSVVSITNSSGTALTSGRDNLVFRITVLGQQGAHPEGNFDDSAGSSEDFMCSYNTQVDLLYGGEGWEVGDEITVKLDQGTQVTYNYTIRIDKIVETTVKANLKAVRPEPTPFDADTAVSVDTILGGMVESWGISGLRYDIIGNGIYIYSDTVPFNVAIQDSDLLRAIHSETNSVSELPNQCKHGYIVKITNSGDTEEDDYYLEFIGENNKNGPGRWQECAAPGIKNKINPSTMPLIIQRQADNNFLLKEYTWSDRLVGDDTTNPFPTFADNTSTINKTLFHRNRLAILSGENVILSRPGSVNEPNFFANTALAISAIDPIDISSSSTHPSDIFDGIETPSGLLLFSTNQQFLLSTDAEIMNPDTAKLTSISYYNYDKNISPISLGTSIAYVDNSGGSCRLMEMQQIQREQEPIVSETSKVVQELLPSTINHVINSPENGLVFLQTIGSTSVTLYGYKYQNYGNERIISSWFKWLFDTGQDTNEGIKYTFIVDDVLYLLDYNNFLVRAPLVKGTSTDDRHVKVSTAHNRDEHEYPIFLDNWTTITGGVYDIDTDKTVFTDGVNGCVFGWHSSISGASSTENKKADSEEMWLQYTTAPNPEYADTDWKDIGKIIPVNYGKPAGWNVYSKDLPADAQKDNVYFRLYQPTNSTIENGGDPTQIWMDTYGIGNIRYKKADNSLVKEVIWGTGHVQNSPAHYWPHSREPITLYIPSGYPNPDPLAGIDNHSDLYYVNEGVGTTMPEAPYEYGSPGAGARNGFVSPDGAFFGWLWFSGRPTDYRGGERFAILGPINAETDQITKFEMDAIVGSKDGFWFDVPSTAINTSTNEITLVAHGLNTTDQLIWKPSAQGNQPGGLSDDPATYFVIRVDGNTIKLAQSTSNASGGVDIDITSQGTGTHFFETYAGNGGEWPDKSGNESGYSTGNRAIHENTDFLYITTQDTTLNKSLLQRPQHIVKGSSFKIDGNWEWNEEFEVVYTNINVSNEQITLTTGDTDHGLVTGDTIKYTKGDTVATGLTDGTTYYVIKVDSNIIKLATSAANATAGTAIDISAQGTGTHKIQKLMNLTFYIGFSYGVDLTFPKIYYTEQRGDSIKVDRQDYLTVQRLKFDVEGNGSIATKIEIMDDWPTVSKVSKGHDHRKEGNYLLGEFATERDEEITVPIYRKNHYIKNINLSQSFENDTDNDVGEFNLQSLTWEGNYSPKNYKRV